MMANIADLNPTVFSDLFGIHRTTAAHTWARFAETSWAAYLAAADRTPPSSSWNSSEVARPD